jgi:anti-sigma factor RsiW
VNSNVHIEELAELYALGELDARERAQVDAHIAQCSDCLRRVGEAEETVLALERIIQPVAPHAGIAMMRRRRVAWLLPAVAAAALIVGLLLPRPFTAPQNPALLAMIHSHFSHAQFSGVAGAPAAKVIYARDRSWLYVVVEGTHNYSVYGSSGGRSLLVGTTLPHGETSDLYAKPSLRLQRVELRERGQTVESAALR